MSWTGVGQKGLTQNWVIKLHDRREDSRKAILYWKPVKCFRLRRNVMCFPASRYDCGCSILDKLESTFVVLGGPAKSITEI